MTDRQKFEITGKITKEKSEEFHNQLKKISDSITFASTFMRMVILNWTESATTENRLAKSMNSSKSTVCL